jgi:acyl-CoA thioester hydrolase
MNEPAGRHRIRVRYCETDRMGVAHHASYVAWLEEARTEWMRARGMTYRELEDSGVFLQVVDVHVVYKRSVTYDDIVHIETTLTERRRVAVTLGYTLTADDGGLVATATTTLACADRGGKLRRLPDAI